MVAETDQPKGMLCPHPFRTPIADAVDGAGQSCAVRFAVAASFGLRSWGYPGKASVITSGFPKALSASPQRKIAYVLPERAEAPGGCGVLGREPATVRVLPLKLLRAQGWKGWLGSRHHSRSAEVLYTSAGSGFRPPRNHQIVSPGLEHSTCSGAMTPTHQSHGHTVTRCWLSAVSLLHLKSSHLLPDDSTSTELGASWRYAKHLRRAFSVAFVFSMHATSSMAQTSPPLHCGMSPTGDHA